MVKVEADHFLSYETAPLAHDGSEESKWAFIINSFRGFVIQ